jgi:hypothetical protein
LKKKKESNFGTKKKKGEIWKKKKDEKKRGMHCGLLL